MTSLGRTITLAAAFAAAAANLAVAYATPGGNEDGTLTFAEGRGENDDRVRMIAGELDGKGILYAEYYTGAALRMAVPYTRVYIDGEETNVRVLRGLALQGQTAGGGFAFTALHGGTELQCTALLWADTSVNCVRDPAWVPPYTAACNAAFQSNVERFQCNGLHERFTNPAIGHDELIRRCTAAFRAESFRTDCLRYGYNTPDRFRETLAACVAAYRTEDERKFCTFYSFAVVNPKERPTVEMIRACDRKHDSDRATTNCVFEKLTGKKQTEPKPRPPLPTDDPTAPLARVPAPKSRADGARLAVSTGSYPQQQLSLRATGGMVADEPVLWVDAYAANGSLKWMQPVDRIVLGKQVRALREVTALDRVKMDGDILQFRVVHAGKRLTCRADFASMFARCR